MARLSDDLRRQIIERADGRCEYCQTPQAIVVEMEIDHVIPQSAGGTTDLDNLCLACVSCNGFKLAFQEAEDPETGQPAPLFNPRVQSWPDHFAWSDDSSQIVGLTPVGRATVERLRLNREQMVQARRLWVQIGWHPPRS